MGKLSKRNIYQTDKRNLCTGLLDITEKCILFKGRNMFSDSYHLSSRHMPCMFMINKIVKWVDIWDAEN